MSLDNNPPFVAFPQLRLERPTVAIVGVGRAVCSPPCSCSAAGMSAFPDEPNHFLLWAQARRSDVHAGSFLPRRLYGEYLEWCLDEEIAHARRRTPFTAVHGRVTALAAGPGGAGLSLAGGETLWASQVVLALGNSAGPALGDAGAGPAEARPTGVIPDAWRPDAVADLPRHRPVVLIGTGLTAVDVMLSLEAVGFTGPIQAVSRRGPGWPPRWPIGSSASGARAASG